MSLLRALALGAGIGAVAALPYGVAHWVFIAPAVPPVVAGAIGGALTGALVVASLARTRAAPSTGRLALGMAALCAPLALVAFGVRPVTGDGPLLWPAALVASLAWAWPASAWAGLRGWPRLGFAAAALVVAGPGEPFVHEGPEPRIVLFFLGLVVSLALAGALAARAAR